jgi:hypothetical protein
MIQRVIENPQVFQDPKSSSSPRSRSRRGSPIPKPNLHFGEAVRVPPVECKGQVWPTDRQEKETYSKYWI